MLQVYVHVLNLTNYMDYVQGRIESYKWNYVIISLNY